MAKEFSYWIGDITGDYDSVSPDEVKGMLDEAYQKSDLIIAFSPHNMLDESDENSRTTMEAMLGDPNVRNIYETGYTAHADENLKNRMAYERNNFGKMADAVDPLNRPKYGSIAWEPDDLPIGHVGYYGSAAIILKKDAVSNRTTYSPANSSERISGDISTLDTPYMTMLMSGAAMEAAGFPRDFVDYMKNEGEILDERGIMNAANLYDEIQVWGDLPIDPEHVEKIRIQDQSTTLNDYYASKRTMAKRFKEDPSNIPDDVTRESYYAPLIALSEKTGVPLEFVEPY